MNSKKEGFILIEVIISLAVISLAVYMVSYSLYENYNSTENNRIKIEMLNTAKQYLETSKNEIKSNGSNLINNYEVKDNIGEYEVTKKVEKEAKYYQCYKINIEVNNNKESIKLSSYVFQQ